MHKGKVICKNHVAEKLATKKIRATHTKENQEITKINVRDPNHLNLLLLTGRHKFCSNFF